MRAAGRITQRGQAIRPPLGGTGCGRDFDGVEVIITGESGMAPGSPQLNERDSPRTAFTSRKVNR